MQIKTVIGIVYLVLEEVSIAIGSDQLYIDIGTVSLTPSKGSMAP